MFDLAGLYEEVATTGVSMDTFTMSSDYATGGGAPIPVFHAGPLARKPSIKGGPYSNGASGARGQYGIMEVHDDGSDEICIDWKVKNFKGDYVLNADGLPLEHSFCMDLNK